MFHGTGLSFQTPVLIHEFQMCAQRIVIHVEDAWLRWLGLLTTDVGILGLTTMTMFWVQCNEALLIATTIRRVAMVQNCHVALPKSMKPNDGVIGQDGIIHPPQR